MKCVKISKDGVGGAIELKNEKISASFAVCRYKNVFDYYVTNQRTHDSYLNVYYTIQA